LSNEKRGATASSAVAPLRLRSDLLDRLVLAADDLEDVELRTREVAVRREADRRPEDGGLERHLAEVDAELGTGDRLVLAGLGDRVRIHLREHVVRGAE